MGIIFLDFSNKRSVEGSLYALPQLQMEKRSSLEAVVDLMSWLYDVDFEQKYKEPINAQWSAAQIRSLLQKYKVNEKLQVQAFCKVFSCRKDENSLRAQ